MESKMNTLPAFLTHSKTAPRTTKHLNEEFNGYQPLLASWLLNITLSLGLYKPTNRRNIIESEDFSAVTGVIFVESYRRDEAQLKLKVNGKIKRHTPVEYRAALKNKLTAYQKLPVRDELYIFENISTLGKLIGLNQAEQAILCFASLLSVFTVFKDALDASRQKVTVSKMGSIIAHLTGHKESEILTALHQESKLITTGILEVTNHEGLGYKLELLKGLGASLAQKYTSEGALLDRFLRKTSPASLQIQNFPHLAQDIKTLSAFLGNALTDKNEGTNVLLYGIPGTGKTELVKALANELKVDLYEITYSDAEGNPITGDARLKAYSLCQMILANQQNALLMFDEIEDVFQNRSGLRTLLGLGSSEQGGGNTKAWINRTLERNTTPAIWITNSANMDDAYLRRFDYSIRFTVPPQKVRMEIARHHLGQFNPPEAWLAHIAANEQTTPAQYERAAKVAKVIGSRDEDYARQLVEQVLDRSATLLGQKSAPLRNTLHTGYDLRFANTSISMPELINGLKQRRQGTFCFYGAAGTGKSELARHIADELGMPCLLRRASDILSKWVGEAEQNIATMFAEARQQEAVLVLDEADSFLADRRDAQHSWEVTQVNELLTQIEAFNGIFICTTNLMEKLDLASLRRFAFKVKFDYLTPDQSWEMFRLELSRQGGDTSTLSDWEKPIRNLGKLTPGDFAVAARQFNILGVQVTAGEMYRQLSEECRIKGGVTGKIGFVS
jgi:SpoVK/Ycf46/Vps4 family AAA+-type ATPase